MEVLYLNLFSVYIFSYFARYFSKKDLSNITRVKADKILVLLSGSILIIVSGLRNNIGDTVFYIHSYETENFTWESVMKGKDAGFGVYQMLLKQFSDDPQILIFVSALITNLLIVMVLYKYSRLFEISLYVFIASGMFLVSMNGMRQFLAAAILFAGTKLLEKRKWLPYFLVVLLASAFHQSALIMIPVYFLVNRKAWTKGTFMLLAAAVLIIIGFSQFQTLLFNALENTQYEGYKNFSEGGANYLRVVVNAVPLAIAYFGRDRLKEINPNSDLIINMTLLGFIFMIISTQNWIFARFSIYFGLYNLILVSWIIKVFRKKDEKLIYYSLLICYFIFFYYEEVLSLNMYYSSEYIKL